MLIILDASGSMNRPDQDGTPYIDKAKDAILELVDSLPDDMLVGLRVYGHREPNTDRARGCQDTELIAPVAPLDRVAIRTAIEGIEASGYTPIGLSLQEAAADLPEAGTRSIVLISDGEDTCAPPDPCQIAEELYGEQFDVRIESVGFLIDTGSAAEQQLRCIAEATGGTYTTVDRADALVAQLGEVTEALLHWRPRVKLSGALDQLMAPELPLDPKADWVTDEPGKIAIGDYDGILMPGEIRWYQLDMWEEEFVWIWSDLEWPPGLDAGGYFETIILDSEGDRVEAPVNHGGYQLRTELPGTDSPMSAATIRAPEWGWPSAAKYLVGLHWDADPEVFLGSLSIGVEVLGGDARRYEERAVIEGALDPAEAPLLALTNSGENEPEWRGTEVRGPLASGETRWYRLDMDPGEVMNVFALFPGDRFVGEGTERQFTMVLTDIDGSPVGSAFDFWPQMSQKFGDDRHQATVSGTTSFEDDPIPETVLIGFTWDGSPGQQSELRFEAEAILDPHRVQMANQPEEEAQAPPTEEDEPIDEPTATDTVTAAIGDASDDGGGVNPILVGIGILALVGAVFALVMRRTRSR